MVNFASRYVWLAGCAALVFCCGSFSAQADPLNSGWALDAGASTITIESEHSSSVVETHTFRAARGIIDVSGAVVLKVRLASLDTEHDLRDVRLRFLFFETFKFPEATIRAHVQHGLVRRGHR